MKRFLRLVSMLLVMAMLMAVPALAADATPPRASAFFHMTSTYLYKTTGANFEVWFDVVAVERMDQIGVSEIRVQRSLDETNWQTVKTYTPEYYSQMIAENTAGHADCVTHIGTNWYYYRAMVVFYAKDERGTGELVRYTQTIIVTP